MRLGIRDIAAPYVTDVRQSQLTELIVEYGCELAYDSVGDSKSLILIIFFHGVFGVGHAFDVRGILKEKGVNFVTPTLPGWGRTSPVPAGSTFTQTLTTDTIALINHLYPDASVHPQLKIFVTGGSLGTVPAQILYGQPFHKFPFGRNIKGMMLMSPFSKPSFDPKYNSSPGFGNWLSIGAPSHYIPQRLLPRLIWLAFKPKFATPESAEQMIRQTLFDRMGEEERSAFEEYKKQQGLKEGELERIFAVNSWRSVRYTGEGFLSSNSIMYEDWGFHPKKDIDAVKLGRRVLVYASKGDHLAPNEHAHWISENYQNAELTLMDGGHISGLTRMDEIWANVLRDV
ncbi:Alpha/Beta hydrolase protein [Xylogone sp. PMI_703]|nr:Alpha/Beta hydrolase protein [Xylogone sp. PMI_703]